MTTPISTTPDESAIAAYLANRLSERDAQAFERYCLEHPEFARDVEHELALKTGFQQVHGLHRPDVGYRVRNRHRWWPMALAAAAVLVMAVTLVIREPGHPRELLAYRAIGELPLTLQPATLSHITLVQLRGQNAFTFAVPLNNVVELRIIPDMKSTEYSLNIAAAGAPDKARIVRELKPVGGALTVYLPAEQLLGHTWHIVSEPTLPAPASAAPQSFDVHFEAADTR